MSIERLDEEIRLPFFEDDILSGDPERLKDYLLALIKAWEEHWKRIAMTTGATIEISDTNVRYYGTRDSTGQYPNGTWRHIKIGTNDFQLQTKIAGKWKKESKWADPTG